MFVDAWLAAGTGRGLVEELEGGDLVEEEVDLVEEEDLVEEVVGEVVVLHQEQRLRQADLFAGRLERCCSP